MAKSRELKLQSSSNLSAAIADLIEDMPAAAAISQIDHPIVGG